MTVKDIFLPITLMAFISCNGQTKNSQSPDKKEDPMTAATPASGTEIMKEDEFWKIIDKSRAASNNNYQAQIGSLKNILLAFDPAETEKFDNRFTALSAASYDAKLWGAAYVINGGCSDDCFDYFREYLIGHGKERFYQTLREPESCVAWIKSEAEDNWEGLQYAAAEAYRQKTGKDLPKTFQPEFKLKGKLPDEEAMMKQYPKLAKKFMGE